MLTRVRSVVVGLSVVWAVLIAVAFACRVAFPLELEWMEGGSLHQALRMRQGLPVYTEPNPEFVPFLYTPLYPGLLAALSFVFPLGYVLGRMVSIAAVVATCVGLWRLVGRENKPMAHQAAAVGMFLAGYVFAFRWLDIARADSMFLALVLWGLLLLRESWGDLKKAVLAGVLVALAFWTKQTAAVFVLASGVGALLVAPRQLWAYAGTIAIIDGGGVLIGNSMTDGWLWTYIFELHQAHAFNHERFYRKTWFMFVHAAPFATVLGGLLIANLVAPLASRKKGSPREERALRVWITAHRGPLYWAWIAAAALLVSALGYSTVWAEPNAFVPGVCFVAAFLGVALPKGGRKELAALGLVAGQLIFALVLEPMYQPIQDDGAAGLVRSYRVQDPWRTVPTADERQRARALRAEIEAVEGPMLTLHRTWWPVLAGTEPHVGSMGINDVGEAQRETLKRQLKQRITAGDYAMLWFEGEPPKWLVRALAPNYVVRQRLRGEHRVRPLVGWMSEAGSVTPYERDQLWLGPPIQRPTTLATEVVADFEDGTLQGFEREGTAFSRPIRSITWGHRAVGPVGGQYFVSSGRRTPRATGLLRSPVFVLPRGGRVELLVGTNGRRKGLSVTLIEVTNGAEARTERLPIPKTRWDMRTVSWEVPSDWAGANVRLQFEDASEKAVLLFDDVRVVAGD